MTETIAPIGGQDLLTQYTDAVQSHLNSIANSRGYDSIDSACSYAAAPNPFQTESLLFVTWRGDVWAYCYNILGQVTRGEIVPPGIDNLIAELPTLGA